MRVLLVCLILATEIGCVKQKRLDANSPEAQEALMVISNINRHTLAYQSTAVEKMVAEANFFSKRLELPSAHPIRMPDIKYLYVSPPWFSVVMQSNSSFWPATMFSNRIFDASIPREERLRALKVVVKGVIETTNFFFSFANGRLRNVQRLSEHEVEYCARIEDYDRLAAESSSINALQAHELATQWLASVAFDVTALETKYKFSVKQPLYNFPHDSTNIIAIPIFFVDWGSPADPVVEVKILGTTKELIQLHEAYESEISFSRRPLLLLTNAIDLIRTPNPPLRNLQRLQNLPTNTPSRSF